MMQAHQALHFRTINGAQALALALAGFELLLIRNLYSPEQLKKLGCSARAAWEAGHPGTVEYYFERTEELLACARAWDDEMTKMKGGGDGSTLERPEKEDVVRIAAAVLTQRKPFADLWKKVVPHLHIPNGGEAKRIDDGDGVGFRMVFPGFKQISINDKEALARLGRA